MGLTATNQKSSKISQKCSTITLTFYPHRIPSLRGRVREGLYFFSSLSYSHKKVFPFLLSLLSLKSVNGWFVISCWENFSDSTGDSSDSKTPMTRPE